MKWLPLLPDLLAVLAQVSGALLWPLMQVTSPTLTLSQLLLPNTSTLHMVEHPYPWAITIGAPQPLQLE